MNNQKGRTIDAEEEEDNDPFHRLPDEMKYMILGRLDTKGICHARAVCKNWHELLSPSSLQALQASTKSSSAFLVRIGYFAEATEDEEAFLYGNEDVERVACFLTVDHDINLGTVDMPGGPFLRRILSGNWSLDVSSNGFVASFPPRMRQGSSVSVCHLSLRWMRVVPGFPDNAKLQYFRGSFYDPSTSQFTLLVGFLRPRRFFIYLYSSETSQWKRVIDKTQCSVENDQVRHNAIYSQGKFFWIVQKCGTTIEGALVWFDLSDERMHRMPLPDCPVHPCQGIDCYDLYQHFPWNVWVLKGCDNSLKLVHYIRGHESQNNELLVWKLEQQSGGSLQWHIVLPLSCIATFTFRPFHNNTNKRGWWLWAEKYLYNNQPCDMLMYDDKGVVRHSISMSDLLSYLRMPSRAEAAVQEIWPLEISHLWEFLAFS